MKKNFIPFCFVLLLLSSTQITTAQSWLLTGNTGNASTNFFGTIDNKAVLFKTNNIERGRLLANGGWQFGLSPNTALIDASGKLSFTGKGGYIVNSSQYVFRYGSDTAKGLYINPTNNQYQFLNSTKKALLYVNTDNGNSGVIGTFKIGAYTLPKTDGTSGQVLQTNGTGTVAWATVSSGGGGGWSLTGNAGTTPGTNFLGTTDNRVLIFKVQNKERMRIKTTGEIGIGTNTPQGTLNVIGASSVSLITPGYFQLGDSAGYNIGMDDYQIQARYNATPATLYLNNSGGSVYIGSSTNSYYGAVGYGSAYGLYGYSPGTGVYGTGDSYGLYGSSSYTGVYGTGSTYGGYFYNAAGRALQGYDGGTGQAVFAYETGSGEALHAEAYGSAGYGVYGYSSAYYGVVGITSNASSYAGYFQGNVFSTGSYVSSDQKLKKDIKDVSGAMSLIEKLQPKTYEFRNDGNYKLMNLPQGKHYGLIAQDVEKILPGLVKETTSDVSRLTQEPQKALDTNSIAKPVASKKAEMIDFKALNYTELIPIMIKGMQEQQAVINNQQQQIDDLKQMVTSLLNTSNSAAAKTNTFNTAGAYLLQNAPNPFSQTTIVKCNVPAGIQTAQIVIFNSEGKQLKNYSLNNKGINTISINAGTLASGTYSYSLLLDGKTADTKTMVITK